VTLVLPPGFVHCGFEVIDSTNDEAKRQAAAGAADSTLITARAQTHGRGRQGRSWISGTGNVLCSLILRPACPPRLAAQLSFVTALAVADALRPLLPSAIPIALKWPNDVLVAGRKVSGILLESATTPEGRLDWLVIGVGINVADGPGDAAVGVALADLGVTASADDVIERFGAAFATWQDRWRRDGFAPIRAAWLAQAYGRHEPVTTTLGQQKLTGRFLDLDPDGGLVLELAEGGRRTIAGGEVYFPSTPTA